MYSSNLLPKSSTLITSVFKVVSSNLYPYCNNSFCTLTLNLYKHLVILKLYKSIFTKFGSKKNDYLFFQCNIH